MLGEMNINSDAVSIKAEVQEASKLKFRIECPDKKKRAKAEEITSAALHWRRLFP
jgi:hypothetical protein